MKTTKLVNKVTIGSKVKSTTTKETSYILSKTEHTNRYYLSNEYYMDTDGIIEGIDRIIDTYRVIPYKRYIFKYKR